MYSPDPETLRKLVEVLGNGALVPRDAFSSSTTTSTSTTLSSKNNSKATATHPSPYVQSSSKPLTNLPVASQASRAGQVLPPVQPHWRPSVADVGKHRLPAAASSMASISRPLSSKLNTGWPFGGGAAMSRSDAVVRLDNLSLFFSMRNPFDCNS